MFYWSNTLNRKLFSGELSQYLTWNFGVESQNFAIFDPFYTSKFKSDQKLIIHNDFIHKNLYPVEWAKLSSTSVVILLMIREGKKKKLSKSYRFNFWHVCKSNCSRPYDKIFIPLFSKHWWMDIISIAKAGWGCK